MLIIGHLMAKEIPNFWQNQVYHQIVSVWEKYLITQMCRTKVRNFKQKSQIPITASKSARHSYLHILVTAHWINQNFALQFGFSLWQGNYLFTQKLQWANNIFEVNKFLLHFLQEILKYVKKLTKCFSTSWKNRLRLCNLFQ